MSKRSAKNPGSTRSKVNAAASSIYGGTAQSGKRKTRRSGKKKSLGTLPILLIVAAALIIIIALIAVGVGCNGKKSSDTSSADVNVQVETDANGETVNNSNSAVSVERQDLVNTDQAQVVITGIDANNVAGFTINLELTNKTDSTIAISAKYAIVEGLSIDPKWASEVGAGETKDSSLTFYKSDYSSYGIGFTDIKLVIAVNETDDLGTQILQQAVRIYPYGQDMAKTYTRTAGDNETVVIDNDSFKMTVLEYTKDDVWGYSVKVYLENKTDTNLWLAGSDVSVNGTALDPFWGVTLPANSSSYSTISWTDAQLSSVGISDVSSIGMTVKATNYDDWEALTIATETITMKP